MSPLRWRHGERSAVAQPVGGAAGLEQGRSAATLQRGGPRLGWRPVVKGRTGGCQMRPPHRLASLVAAGVMALGLAAVAAPRAKSAGTTITINKLSCPAN